MIKRLALLTLFATPFLAHAQVRDNEVVAAPLPAQLLVTYDVVGTFPANVPLTRMTAPGASFLLEVSFPQTVPAQTSSTFNLGTSVASGSYSYEGRTYRVTSGYYSVANHDFNARSLRVVTPIGTLTFFSGGTGAPVGPQVSVGFPVHPNAGIPTNSDPWPMGTATFLAVDMANNAETVGPWDFTFTNVRGQSITGYYANVFDVTGRLVLPQPHPPATR